LIESKSFLFINDLTNSELIERFKANEFELCYPIFYNKELTGILFYGKKKNQSIYHREELELLYETIKKAEDQINNIHQVDDIAEEVSQKNLVAYQHIYQVQIIEEFKKLGKIKKLDDLCEHSMRLICRFLNIQDVDIYIYDEKEKTFFCKTTNAHPQTLNQIDIPEDDYLISYITQIDDIILRDKLANIPRELKIKELKGALETIEKLNAEVIIPLVDERAVGFIAIGKGKMYSKEDFLILHFVGDKLAATISNIMTHDDSNIDALTGIYNKKHMYVRLEEEVISSGKNLKDFAFMMLDCDSFKQYNDHYGHPEGDYIIIIIADVLGSIIRPTDAVFRYGGDEFAILLPGMTQDHYDHFIKRFEENFNNNDSICTLCAKFHPPVSISFGVSFFTEERYPKDYVKSELFKITSEVIEEADNNLYKQKEFKKKKNKKHPIGFGNRSSEVE
jgi:diguanylate cyclase (GGDEF)-like protein